LGVRGRLLLLLNLQGVVEEGGDNFPQPGGHHAWSLPLHTNRAAYAFWLCVCVALRSAGDATLSLSSALVAARSTTAADGRLFSVMALYYVYIYTSKRACVYIETGEPASFSDTHLHKHCVH
jgi:hypothetical protein